ncbi:MAG: AraC family transcriptional regulator [Bacteroidetes bacterium]|nr:AraC family transcriptional regulator [Bacteroidota bacterium]MBI3482553.1 AraC family transcriptional regulator [Bacteroidota bacterium]
MKDFIDQILEVIIYGGIAIGLFVSLLLNNRNAKRSRANIFLSVLLISLSFSITHILFAGRILDNLSVEAYPVGDPTFLLIAPLLWFYIQELTGNKVKLSIASILHFLPFLFVIFCSLYFRSRPDQSILHIVQAQQKLVVIVFWVFTLAQFTVYQVIIRKGWVSYQSIIQQEVSNTEDVNIEWVRFFLGVFWLINFFFLFSLFAVIHLDYMRWLGKVIALLFSLSIFALGYKGILQKEVFHTSVGESTSNTDSSLVESETRKIDIDLKNRLLDYMDAKKPYLDPELTLSWLAKELNISRSQLSQLINDGVGDNFYNFVNKYRVEQVKKFMNDSSMNNLNMLGLALEAGFKSKSTFNLIFKRFTGLTPTEFRKNLS